MGVISNLSNIRSLAVPLTVLHYGVIGLRQARLSRQHPVDGASDAKVAEVAEQLHRDGWVVVDGYVADDICRDAIAQLDRVVEEGAPRLRTEYAGCEHRYFGSEELNPSIASFANDRFLSSVAEAYMRTKIVNICTLANRSLPAVETQHVTDRWHRDSFGKQIKAIAYMSDVNDENGAFEFIPGSHRFPQIVSDVRNCGLKAFQWRLSDEDVTQIIARSGREPQKFVARAGSVVLVDTCIVHRASPIVSGRRYALTNYYVERGRYRQEICDALGVPFRPKELSAGADTRH